MKAFVPHDWLMEGFVPHDWLMKGFVPHDWLMKAFVPHDWLMKASIQCAPERFAQLIVFLKSLKSGILKVFLINSKFYSE